MMVEVPHHLVVLLLRDLAPGVPGAQDVVALVAVPVAPPGVPPAPTPRPEEPAHGPEESEEQEERPQSVEGVPDRTRPTGRQHASDDSRGNHNREDPRQQDERRPTPHAIRSLRFQVHVLPRPDVRCTAVALEPVGGIPLGFPPLRRKPTARSDRSMHRGASNPRSFKGSRRAGLNFGPLFIDVVASWEAECPRTGGGPPRCPGRFDRGPPAVPARAIPSGRGPGRRVPPSWSPR